MDLINNNISRNVQTGCTGYIHIAAMHDENNEEQFIKSSHVNVIRPSLCLGA